MTSARRTALLLIEDDKVDQMAFRRSMREQGLAYDVTIAGSVREARAIMAGSRFDVIVSDFYLGDGTPLELLDEIREMGTPVIVVTAAGDKESAAEAILKGASDFLIKDQNYNYLRVLPLTITKVLSNVDVSEPESGEAGMENRDDGIEIPDESDSDFQKYDTLPFQRLVVDQTELVSRTLPDGTLLFVNEVFCRYFRKTREELIGKKYKPHVPKEDALRLNAHFTSLSENGPYATIDHRIIQDTGEIRWFRRTDRALFDNRGEIIEFQTVGMDITDQKNAELNLLQELERKRDFMNVASHELRTPLQPVIGYLEMLIDDADGFGISPAVLDILKKVHFYTVAERTMVTQMLEMSLLDSVKDRFSLHYSLVWIRNLAEMVIRSGKYADVAAFSLDIPEDASLAMNEPYLFEILDHLILNAIRYSREPRKIRISFEDSGKECILTVQDNGVGIPEKNLQSIFEPFFIGDGDKLSRSYGRLGLGLTMTKKRIETLGGKITVESTPGVGSTFRVTLPKTTE